jgi:hypothetical protein
LRDDLSDVSGVILTQNGKPSAIVDGVPNGLVGEISYAFR